MATKTQKKTLNDVLVQEWHPAFNREVITLNNGDVALAAGDTLVGKLALNTSGTTWKILDDGDTISAASVICPILDARILQGPVAGDASAFATKVTILRRGPALVHGDELEYDADVVKATVDAAMLALGIKKVSETGLAFTPASVV